MRLGGVGGQTVALDPTPVWTRLRTRVLSERAHWKPMT